MVNFRSVEFLDYQLKHNSLKTYFCTTTKKEIRLIMIDYKLTACINIINLDRGILNFKSAIDYQTLQKNFKFIKCFKTANSLAQSF